MRLILAVEGATTELPMPAWMFGAAALGVLFALLALLWAFRSVGHRHGPRH